MVALQNSKDNWDAKGYQSAAAFVPLLAGKVVEWLDVQEGDKILDIGCGDGILTQKIAEQLTDGAIFGVDASNKMIEAAVQLAEFNNTPKSKLQYSVLNCTTLSEVIGNNELGMSPGAYTKIFSNAALHWILRAPATRISVLSATYTLLTPGGHLVFEMGGAGNIAELRTAMLSSAARRVGISAARDVDPWFFPDETWMRGALEGCGFVVEKCELEYRPTRCESGEGGGVEGWVRLMGSCFIDIVAKDGEGKEDGEAMVKEICEALETVCGREDGSQWMGYVRLRVRARKRSEGLRGGGVSSIAMRRKEANRKSCTSSECEEHG